MWFGLHCAAIVVLIVAHGGSNVVAGSNGDGSSKHKSVRAGLLSSTDSTHGTVSTGDRGHDNLSSAQSGSRRASSRNPVTQISALSVAPDHATAGLRVIGISHVPELMRRLHSEELKGDELSAFKAVPELGLTAASIVVTYPPVNKEDLLGVPEDLFDVIVDRVAKGKVFIAFDTIGPHSGGIFRFTQKDPLNILTGTNLQQVGFGGVLSMETVLPSQSSVYWCSCGFLMLDGCNCRPLRLVGCGPNISDSPSSCVAYYTKDKEVSFHLDKWFRIPRNHYLMMPKYVSSAAPNQQTIRDVAEKKRRATYTALMERLHSEQLDPRELDSFTKSPSKVDLLDFLEKISKNYDPFWMAAQDGMPGHLLGGIIHNAVSSDYEFIVLRNYQAFSAGILRIRSKHKSKDKLEVKRLEQGFNLNVSVQDVAESKSSSVYWCKLPLYKNPKCYPLRLLDCDTYCVAYYSKMKKDMVDLNITPDRAERVTEYQIVIADRQS